MRLEPNRVPFPSIPETLKTEFSLSELSLRPFGYCAEDREVNFNQPLRPYLEVEILECCTDDRRGAKPNSQFFWNMEIGKRIECLLTIATVRDRDAFMIPLRCLNSACQEGIEIDFSMEEISELQSLKNAEKFPEILVGHQTVRIRRPKGSDQLKWLEQSFKDEHTATQVMLKTLVREDDRLKLDSDAIAQGEWIPAFNQTMEEIDPLVNFQVEVQCPYCGAKDSHSIDFGAFALERFRNTQQQLLDMVHRLASRYHWNESEIFAIPAWRRESYLARLDREEH
ncbi:MAG: hypothetical protein KME60_27810 [Cyanomargarita calcarea GSE-NOS-MK-12-04C]|jgi:hypothetical protein|uniref:Uncharacterized protein n=1 Tax=Cyanomargarita calcarea GSE-NOS-MK-12-04C TaxID=2839659 RepID=A0A951UVL4_9CYAN|nr:hypothetical protein [Cyanomargarita calcarea GSE-NOS-MK-12-04C]